MQTKIKCKVTFIKPIAPNYYLNYISEGFSYVSMWIFFF